MEKKEFLKRLKEDKFFSEPEKLAEYRFPVIEYYLKHHSNATTIVDNKPVSIKNVKVRYNPDKDFIWLNIAFEGIKKQLKKLEKL